MARTVIIDKRFCGPPDSGQGGYVCGVLASDIEGVAEVVLKSPPPLDQPMDIVAAADGGFEMRHSAAAVATARPAVLDLECPAPPSFTDAGDAAASFRGFQDHIYPTCFVCGPERSDEYGLRVFPGPLGVDGMVAAPWVPNSALADEAGMVRPEFLWSVLDCPGGFAVMAPGEAAMLGTMTAALERRAVPGQRHVVIGWPIAREGRKLYCGTAVFSEGGSVVARAKAVWITIAAA